MMLSSPRSVALTAITWVVAILATVDWMLRPERAWVWALAGGLMAAIRLVVGPLASRRRSIAGAGVAGAAILALSLAVALAKAVGVEDWTSERTLGVVVGSMLLVLGNAIPKASVSPTDRSCLAGGSYAIRRFAGWMFAGAGAVGLGAWLFAPASQAWTVSTVACFSATALVVVRCLANPSAKRVGD